MAHTGDRVHGETGSEVTADPRALALDPAARNYLLAAQTRPPVTSVSVAEQRAAFVELQRTAPGPSATELTERWVTIPCGRRGSLRARIVEPSPPIRPAATVLYLHGGGWVTGDASTHDRIVSNLATRSRAAVVLPEYALSPEARYPAALEQAHAAASWISSHGAEHGLDPTRVAVAGDSEGANLAIGTVILGLRRNTFQFRQLVAITPVTDAAFDTASYLAFAEGYGLSRDAMRFYWDHYAPDPRDRRLDTVCPLHADAGDLARFPPSLIITAEADVVRDEGEAFAARLRLAGAVSTAVRYEGTIHDFMVLSALRDTVAARAATAQAAAVLSAALHPPGAQDVNSRSS